MLIATHVVIKNRSHEINGHPFFFRKYLFEFTEQKKKHSRVVKTTGADVRQHAYYTMAYVRLSFSVSFFAMGTLCTLSDRS